MRKDETGANVRLGAQATAFLKQCCKYKSLELAQSVVGRSSAFGELRMWRTSDWRRHATLLIGVTGRDATWRTGHGPGGARPGAAAEHK